MEKKHLFIFMGAPATGKSDLARVIGNNNAIIFDDVYPGSEKIKILVEELATFNSPRTTYIAIVNSLETKAEIETAIINTSIFVKGESEPVRHSLSKFIKISEVEFRRWL